MADEKSKKQYFYEILSSSEESKSSSPERDDNAVLEISSSTSRNDDDEEEDSDGSDCNHSEDEAQVVKDEDCDYSHVDAESMCNKVIQLIRGRSDIQDLKLNECKAYLRRYNLRLSGTKEECIERIKEHWKLKDGNGEVYYPRSSFKIDCTGDVCKGDIVLFHQNVGKMKRRRSFQRRTVAGRIVKESYGAAKQQHTFTVEVLWSRGTKKLDPLFPLLVKGRILYKMKTFRQPWKYEKERLEVLSEKHQRGAAARSIRAMRQTDKSLKYRGAKHDNNFHHLGSSRTRETTYEYRDKLNCKLDDVPSMTRISIIWVHLEQEKQLMNTEVPSMTRTSIIWVHLEQEKQLMNTEVPSMKRISIIWVHLEQENQHMNTEVPSMTRMFIIWVHLEQENQHMNTEVPSMTRTSIIWVHLEQEKQLMNTEVPSMTRMSIIWVHLEQENQHMNRGAKHDKNFHHLGSSGTRETTYAKKNCLYGHEVLPKSKKNVCSQSSKQNVGSASPTRHQNLIKSPSLPCHYPSQTFQSGCFPNTTA